jgi:hypothetical protein
VGVTVLTVNRQLKSHTIKTTVRGMGGAKLHGVPEDLHGGRPLLELIPRNLKIGAVNNHGRWPEL